MEPFLLHSIDIDAVEESSLVFLFIFERNINHLCLLVCLCDYCRSLPLWLTI